MNQLGGSVFLSYSRRDFYLAEEVYADLLGEGVDVWMDMAEISPGDAWRNGLRAAIEAADSLLLVATPRSVQSDAVREELGLAAEFGKPVHVLVAQDCDLDDELAAAPRHRARVSRPSSALSLVAAALLVTALCSLALAVTYLWASVTDDSGLHVDARWSAVPLLASDFHLVLALGCLAATGAVTTCAAALIRRRWRWSFLLPLLAVCAVLQLVNHYFGQPVPEPLRAAVRAGAVAAGVLIVVILGSRSVLRRSRTGSGSLVARFRVLHRLDNAAAIVNSLLGDHVPFGRDDLSDMLEPADRARSFTVVHEPADAPLAEQLSEVCRTAGLVDASDPERADRRLLLVTNHTDVDRVQRGESGERGIPVLACSLDGVAGSELMGRQWVDFRNAELNPRELARVTDRAPKKESRFRTVVPVADSTRRLPSGVSLNVRLMSVAALGFTLVVLSNTYWNLLGARISTVRLFLAMATALVAADAARLIGQRTASVHRIRRERILLTVMSVGCGSLAALEPGIPFGHRMLSWAIAGVAFSVSFLPDNDLRAWLPTASMRPGTPAAGFPVTLSSLLTSPHCYAVLMVAGATVLVSPL